MNKIMVFIMAAFTLVALGSLASACSCMAPGTPAEEFANYDVVFQGEVINVNENGMSNLVTFDVEKSWKGVWGEEIKINTAKDSAGCGYNFEEDKSYVVYAPLVEEELTVTLCSRTALVDDAQEDLDYLNTLPVDFDRGNFMPVSFWQKISNFFRNLFD